MGADGTDAAANAVQGTVLQFRSGGIELRTASRELRVDGELVTIEGRAFDLLAYLMRNANRVVDKDELLDAVWEGRPVSESTVAQAASRARKALKSQQTDQYIATVYGLGYRFVPPVEQGEAKAEAEIQSSHRWPRTVAALAVILLAIVAVTAWFFAPDDSPLPVRVAFLPVQNETGDAELEWVRLGLLPLMDSAFNDSGVVRVSAGTVLATLRRYPEAQTPAEQAEVLRLSSGVARVLVPTLLREGEQYRLDIGAVEQPEEPAMLSFAGDDVAVLAVATATSLAERLDRWQGARRAQSSLATDDPFINEAFVRGLDARLRGRYEEAARFFDTVLAAAPDLHEAKYHLALVTRRLGDWDYSQQLHTELLEAARANGDRQMLAAVQSISGVLAWRRGDKRAAEDWYGRALAIYREQGNADYVASVTSNLGILAATRGDFAQAETHFLEALAHYERSGDRFNEATARKNLGNLYSDQGRYDLAEQILLESLAIRQQLQLPLEVALTLSVLADIDMTQGNWSKALAYQQRVLSAAEEYAYPVLQAQAKADISAALRRLGRLEEARQSATQAYALATELDSPTNQAFSLLQQGRAESDLGHLRRAAELFGESAQLYASIEEPLGHARALIAGAEAAVAGDQLDRAEAMLAEADSVIASSELEQLDTHLARASLAAAMSRLDAAVEHAAQAWALAKEGEAPIEALDAGGRLGQLLLRQNPDDKRLPALVAELEPRAEVSADALAFLVQYYSDRDPARALDLAQKRKNLIGEGWRARDEEGLRALRRAAALGE